MNDFFIEYGYFGMGLASFLTGTFVPMSSEAILSALLATIDLNPWITIVSATIGNVLATVFNYLLGRLGNINTVCRILRIKPHRLQRAQRWCVRYGSWTAIFTFLPVLGTALAVILGAMRTNPTRVFLLSAVAKFVRYVIVAWSVLWGVRALL